MKKLIFIILFPLCAFLLGQNKYSLDLDESELQKDKLSFSKSATHTSQQISNDQISATLINGGYFTLGTTSGKSDVRLDDNCPLTFGHPYAMTSYPVFSIDSTWYTLDSFFPGESSTIMHSTEDSLTITLSINNLVDILFSISIEGENYEFSIQSTNLDTISHNIGLGLVYDPTHGAGGDGALFVADEYIQDETVFDSALSSFNIWERPQAAKGLGLNFQLDEAARLIAANWPQIFETDQPKLSEATGLRLYDLALKMYWPEVEAEAQESNQVSLQISLIEPDFSSDVFTRWDLPSFFSIEGNIMFPREFSTSMEINSSQGTAYPNSTLQLEFPNSVYAYTDNYNLSVPADDPAYQQINMRSELVYEDKVVGITANIVQDDQVLDTFNRLVFVPATPVSETGLLLNIDTILTNNLPQVGFTFNTKNEETGQYIYNIEKENVFLYENSERIMDFSFGKDTTGGLDQTDIIFVLDVTGSMSNEIADVKNNIVEFANSLSANGTDYQLGLVTFLDVIENIYPFTKDVDLFHQRIADQYAHGGGDGPENSLDALDAAADFDFRDQAERMVIWITDMNYHEQDNVTDKSKLEVINKILSNGIVVNAIGNQTFKSEYYDPITIPSGGNYYDIYGNFRDILLDISKSKSTNNYLVSYNSNSSQEQNDVKIELRYSGLGGYATFNYSTSGLALTNSFAKLNCYPNPFNPSITFSIGSLDYKQGSLKIYNVLGQVVKEFHLKGGISNVTWHASNDLQNTISTGFYYVALKLVDNAGKAYHEKSKILYLK